MPSINSIIENVHVVNGLPPVADAFSGTVYSDIVNLGQYGRVAFLVYRGVGTTGTAVLTVEASDDVSASNVEAVAFKYATYAATDTQGATTAATTTGFTFGAGSNLYAIVEIDAEALSASGYKYARLKSVEGTDSAVLGGILVLMANPRYAQSELPSATT